MRIGGGYKPLSEFLELYTPIELGKLQKKEGKYSVLSLESKQMKSTSNIDPIIEEI